VGWEEGRDAGRELAAGDPRNIRTYGHVTHSIGGWWKIKYSGGKLNTVLQFVAHSGIGIKADSHYAVRGVRTSFRYKYFLIL
jgi:hypothetical protein